jgi:hypothetical protein
MRLKELELLTQIRFENNRLSWDIYSDFLEDEGKYKLCRLAKKLGKVNTIEPERCPIEAPKVFWFRKGKIIDWHAEADHIQYDSSIPQEIFKLLRGPYYSEPIPGMSTPHIGFKTYKWARYALNTACMMYLGVATTFFGKCSEDDVIKMPDFVPEPYLEPA